MVGEPNAAALTVTEEGDTVCLVVDLDGGTLDAAVVEVAEGVHELKAVAGSNQVGGIDFDRAVAAHVEAQLLSLLDGDTPIDSGIWAEINREAAG